MPRNDERKIAVTEHARAPTVYRVWREAWSPKYKAEGYRRLHGTQASWKRPVGGGQKFSFGAFVSPYGGLEDRCPAPVSAPSLAPEQLFNQRGTP